MIVCVCNCLNEAKIRDAIANHASTYEDVLQMWGCNPNCRTCEPVVTDLIEQLSATVEE